MFSGKAALEFRKPILVYIPCYNCAQGIVETLSNIPLQLQDQIECLVVDNQSTDSTAELVIQEIKEKKHPFRISLIKNKKNIGYAGSQKLAYSLVSQSAGVKYVVMLHGDGQYSPSLLTQFIAQTDKNYAIVNGYRDKKIYRHQEETPFVSYCIIKVLSWLESMITGFAQKEWHSGFVMYRKEFLRKIPLKQLSNRPHIDGEFLICAGVLGEQTLGLPVYKKYIDYEAFCGIPRIKHVLHVFGIMLKFRRKYYHRMLEASNISKIDFDYDVIT